MSRQRPIKREFLNNFDVHLPEISRVKGKHLIKKTCIDFVSLDIEPELRHLLEEAFWSHVGIRPERSILTHWAHVKVFERFVRETRIPHAPCDMSGSLLVRYIEWLNLQTRQDGTPWTKSTRAGTYTTFRILLQWLERCKPGQLVRIVYPINPFPWRNRDTVSRQKTPARTLRAVLKACETEIANLRARRVVSTELRYLPAGKLDTVEELAVYVAASCEGRVIPTSIEMRARGHSVLKSALERFGGLKEVEPSLYPRAESLLPYYLAILIHAAGNPEAIVSLLTDCLQPLPLLDDREVLVWFKPRANSFQRRSFSKSNEFEPPTLVREILEWNARLRALACEDQKNQLFLFKGARGVSVLSTSLVKKMIACFCERHGLPRLSLASIRPGVLSAFYRATGDLSKVKAIANHSNIQTTVRYVEMPEVQAQNRGRVASLQLAFADSLVTVPSKLSREPRAPQKVASRQPAGVVSMFGFGCNDPYGGAAPATKRGELCTNFMGCFTCPNAVISPEPSTLARLLQARDHLRDAAASLHPSRWELLYAPQLRILQEDILPRFTAVELLAAEKEIGKLPPLPELR